MCKLINYLGGSSKKIVRGYTCRTSKFWLPILYKKHPTLLKLGAFYFNLLKIYSIYGNWAPSSVRKTRLIYHWYWYIGEILGKKHLKREARAVASLTVPGGQEIHFPHFFLKVWSIFLIFPQAYFLPHFGPGYATEGGTYMYTKSIWEPPIYC